MVRAARTDRVGWPSAADRGSQLVLIGLDPVELPRGDRGGRQVGSGLLSPSGVCVEDPIEKPPESQGENGEQQCQRTPAVAPESLGADCPATMAGSESMVSLNGRSKRDKAASTVVAPRLGEAASPDSAASPFAPRKFASLSSFVVGPCNKLAMYSAEMVVRNPGKVTPLFIHGPTSVGKTHLLEGIWSASARPAAARRPCIFPPSSSRASSSRPCAAMGCRSFAASIAEFAC